MTPKVLLGIPSSGSINAQTVITLISTILENLETQFLGSLDVVVGPYIPVSRNQLVESALRAYYEEQITHIWFIDHDMILPKGTLTKLLSHQRPVVGGAYYVRTASMAQIIQPVAFEVPWKMLPDIPASGLLKVDGMGMGCTLISCALLEQMANHFNDRLWFQQPPVTIDGVTTLMGEDVFFFTRLKQMGVDAYLDCDVQCGHIKTHNIGRMDYEVFRSLAPSTLGAMTDPTLPVPIP